MTGRTHELKVDKTTIGRLEDNTFQIAEPSVSSHHCEILQRGTEIVVRDLNSTNGTFIGNEKVSESVLRPGQILRLGQIEMRLETNESSAPSSSKKLDQTMVMQQGVSLSEFDQSSKTGFDTKTSGFSKKENKVNKIFLIAGIALGVIIVGLLLLVLILTGK